MIEALRGDLDRVGVGYARAGAAPYVAVHDLGDEVWFRGPPRGLAWKRPATVTLELVHRSPDDAGGVEGSVRRP